MNQRRGPRAHDPESGPVPLGKAVFRFARDDKSKIVAIGDAESGLKVYRFAIIAGSVLRIQGLKRR
jgi:hypothetical protein